MAKQIEQRVEKHIIKSSNPFFPLLMDFCHKSKNLYNHANFIVRQAFINEDKWIRAFELDKLVRADEEFPDYREMPTAQSAQQLIKVLDRNWKSFFKSIKDWSKNKDKYLGKPKMPGFLPKDGYMQLILTNQECRLRDGELRFPKAFNGFTITPKFVEKDNFVSFQQIRFIPHKSRIVVELVHNIEVAEMKSDNHRHVGIDIGVNNLATVCNNIGEPAFAINGRPLKSINQFYNKEISHYREVCKRMNGKDYSKRMDRLTEKRNAKIDDYLHKASRQIVNWCAEHDICTIVIGKNKEWKQKSCMSRKVNQSFVGIPFAKLIEMIEYKAKELGITVILTEESFSSGTSFIDNEEPIRENYNKSRRKHRGLFISNEGIEINADLNGAYQILRKVFPDVTYHTDCSLHPQIINIEHKKKLLFKESRGSVLLPVVVNVA